jgi:release factor glutamine methyltransferase
MGERRREALQILDLGVGSAALFAALLVEFVNARGVGVDLSAAAARIAKANLEALNLDRRSEIRVGLWAEGLHGPFDLVVANPPYIPSADIAALPAEVRDFDPPLALDGGADGLDAYRAIIPAVASLIAPGGFLLMEVGAGQAADVLALVDRASYADAAVRRDLAGIERVIIAGAGPQSETHGGGRGREPIDAVA